MRSALLPVVRRLNELDQEIRQSDQAILALAKSDETARRLMTVPGIGPVTASALAASIQDICEFRFTGDTAQLPFPERPEFRDDASRLLLPRGVADVSVLAADLLLHSP